MFPAYACTETLKTILRCLGDPISEMDNDDSIIRFIIIPIICNLKITKLANKHAIQVYLFPCLEIFLWQYCFME